MIAKLALIGGTLLFTAAAAMSGGHAVSTSAPPADAAAVSRGARAWADNCAECHNLRSPQDLADAQASVAVAHMRVRAKLPGDMARDILAFLQASNDRQAAAEAPMPSGLPAAPVVMAAGDPVRGAQVYQETCVACHGENGKGALEGVPDFTDPRGRLAKPDEVLVRNMIEGFQSPGSPMPMPPKGGNPDLSDQHMVDVLPYMRRQFGGR